MEPLDRFDRATLLAVWATIATAILVGAVVGVLFARNEHRLQVEKAEILTSAVARAFEEHVHGIMRDLDRLAQVTAQAFLAHPEVDLAALLEDRGADPTLVVQLGVIGPDGHLATSSLGPQHAGMDLSDRAHFHHHAAGTGDPIFISDPLVGRASGRWSVQFTRRIDDAAGRFAGVVVISIDPRYLAAFYSSVDMGPDGAVTLVKSNGVVLARSFGEEETLGKKTVLGTIPARLALGPSGTTFSLSPIDGVERILAWRAVRNYPLVVQVGQSSAFALAGARALVLRVAVVGGLAVAAMLMLGWLSRKILIARAVARRARAALASEYRERMFLASILDTTAVLVAVFDRQGRLRLANERFRALTDEQPVGGARAALLPRLLGIEPEQLDIERLPPTCEATILDGRGKRRKIAWAATTIRDERGRASQVVLFGFDDTERREAELALYQAGRLLTLGELATGLAHELNQPLMVMQLAAEGLAEAMSEEPLDRAYLQGKVDRIVRHVGRAARIIDNMRIFGSRKERMLRPVDVTVAVGGVLGMLGAELALSGITVREPPPAGTWFVRADRVMLEQVLINLVINARDAILHRGLAAPGGPEAGWIEITAQAGSPGMVALVVADNGGGIPEQVMPRIFDPFFTTKPEGQGTGLGLALSYGLVRDLGGRITAANGPEGAVFTVELPAADALPAGAAPALPARA
jgi:C4-dicarboxylate-specific signal transduction histidine kinase